MGRLVARMLGVAWLVCVAGCSGGLSTSSSGTSGTVSGADNAPGSGIFGRLVDSSNQPVSGAQVSVRLADGSLLGTAATTDSDGNFQLPLAVSALPAGAVLHVSPPARPELEQPLELLAGSHLGLNLQLRPDGGLAVQSLRAPADAVQWVADPHAPWLVPFHAGVSAPFAFEASGQFAHQGHDLALAWKSVDDARWTLQRLTGDVAAPTLQLGSQAAARHGQVLELRAVAVPAGMMQGHADFDHPAELGEQAFIGPPLTLVPVVTRMQRVTLGRLLPAAVLAPVGGAGLTLAAADLAALGVSAGQRVALTLGTRATTVQVHAAEGGPLAQATALVEPAALTALGLDPGRRLAGYTLTVAAVSRR